MKKLALLFVLASGLVFSQTKSLKVVSSKINWWGYKVAKTEASSHQGTIDLSSGTVILKNGQLAGGSFVLDMNSINATDLSGEYQTKLNNHLKNGDFFEVEKYPTGTFKMMLLRKNNKPDFNYIITGNLTLKGSTNAVTFPAKIEVKNGVLTLTSDKFTIDRQKWGVSYKSTMKDIVIKDDIDLQVTLSAK
ncbi:YceI family protein [Riemerella columbipharyngis]|uniref:Polyisoprenoid-binding protein YceI n=1 Tax=Riemerella columbipharyngis TaxID=1071918 RepID=A0A1G7D9I4_9FLAO|nr:YceI family protein [Riemerella columbipharyngis]SDE47566.1 Polyisoprenoid-binding protein YceI [Riemerella columbipharyngis]